jgi:hypothetical protein
MTISPGRITRSGYIFRAGESAVAALTQSRARLDAQRVEQLGELAVEIATEFGDDRIGEVGRRRWR